ncbi:MAG: hypothetical protein EKK52_01300 [Burkholderiales bacterium]|jgi:hypothetical protein|nr:MAG: hypothetical protein EKK52_01300 [Burkholderiales bacterium]
MPTPHEPEQPDSDEAPDDARQLSLFLMSQLDARIRAAVSGAGQQTLYYVIRSQSTGVLSIIAASSLGDEQEPVGKPMPFADCIAYVNAQMVAREAQGKPAHPSDPEPTP